MADSNVVVVGKFSDPRRDPRFYDPTTPVFRDAHGVVHVFSRADVTRVLADPERIFSRRTMPPGPDRHPTFDAPWAQDPYPAQDGQPGRHAELCAVIAPWFRTTAVRTLRDGVRGVVDELIGAILAKASGTGGFDLATEFAHPLALRASGLLLGLDLDETDWRAKINTHVSAPDFFSIPRQWDIDAAIWRLVAMRQLTGTPRGQLVDQIIEALRGKQLGPGDVVPLIWMTLVAATDTTAASIVSMLGLLDEHGELDAICVNLDNDRALSMAVEEALRLGQVFDANATLATAATTIGGLPIEPGTLVVAWYSAANRDCERGDEFDVTRHPNQHLTFGPPQDPHTCLGAYMARMIMRQALHDLVTRLPGLRRDTGRETRQVIGINNTYLTAPFSFDPPT